MVWMPQAGPSRRMVVNILPGFGATAGAARYALTENTRLSATRESGTNAIASTETDTKRPSTYA